MQKKIKEEGAQEIRWKEQDKLDDAFAKQKEVGEKLLTEANLSFQCVRASVVSWFRGFMVFMNDA